MNQQSSNPKRTKSVTTGTAGSPVQIHAVQLNVFKARPPKVKLNVSRKDQLEIQAPKNSNLRVFFFPGIYLEDQLYEAVPNQLKGEYAPFGVGEVPIQAGNIKAIGPPGQNWPRKKENAYPFLIYVESTGQLAHGDSPPKIILL